MRPEKMVQRSNVSSIHGTGITESPSPELPMRCGVHCALIPAALMMGHHFSISVFCNMRSASGD
jgi:hypothetical protein